MSLSDPHVPKPSIIIIIQGLRRLKTLPVAHGAVDTAYQGKSADIISLLEHEGTCSQFAFSLYFHTPSSDTNHIAILKATRLNVKILSGFSPTYAR
jgi:hypothetical protein